MDKDRLLLPTRPCLCVEILIYILFRKLQGCFGFVMNASKTKHVYLFIVEHAKYAVEGF